MLDTEALEQKIIESGKKRTILAKKVGCTRQYFKKKCEGIADFKTLEVIALCEELGITTSKERDRIFFAKNVTKKSD